jgi:hypothetical protein
VEELENFQYVDRILYKMIANSGVEQFEKLALVHVIIGGKPLVIDGFEEVFDPWTFTPSWLFPVQDTPCCCLQCYFFSKTHSKM